MTAKVVNGVTVRGRLSFQEFHKHLESFSDHLSGLHNSSHRATLKSLRHFSPRLHLLEAHRTGKLTVSHTSAVNKTQTFMSRLTCSSETNVSVAALQIKTCLYSSKTDLNIKNHAKRKRNEFNPFNRSSVKASFSLSLPISLSFFPWIQPGKRKRQCMGNRTEKASVGMSALKGVCFDRKNLVATRSCRYAGSGKVQHTTRQVLWEIHTPCTPLSQHTGQRAKGSSRQLQI